MTIRAKLIILMGASLLSIASVVSLMAYLAHQDSYQAAMESSKTTIQSIASYSTLFFKTAEENSAFLAGLSQTSAATEDLPSYLHLTAPRRFALHELSPQAQELEGIRQQMLKSNSSYLALGLGSINGGFLEYPPIKYPAGFDPRKRPWFKAATSSSTGAAYSIYLTASGTPVCSFTHQVTTDTGKVVGVSYIEVSLASFSKRISSMEIGRTGRLTLIDPNGVIIASRKTDALFTNVADKKVPGLYAVYSMSEGAHMINVNGKDVLVNLFGDQRGWKYVYAIDADEVFAGTYSMLKTSVFFSIFMLMVVCSLGVYILRSINRPLSLLSSTSETIANGDIHATMPDKSFFSGELLSLYESFAKMLAHISETLRKVQESQQKAHAEEENARVAMIKAKEAGAAAQAKTEAMLLTAGKLEQAGSVISSASANLAIQVEQSDQSAAESAQRLSEAATAMNEMNATVQEVARNAGTAFSASAETKEKAQDGARIVEQSLQSIERVRHISAQLKDDMNQLNEHAQDITRIMGVISDIADQTNLLALNAAIEAARAGEAGRGFAVVADEVRKLAEKTMASTTDVSSAITVIQNSTEKSMSSMDNAMEQVNQATDMASRSGQALQEIVATVEGTADLVHAIATASEEQSAVSEEINQSIVQVDKMVRQTAEAMSEASRAVADLADQAHGLTGLIQNLKED